MARKDAAREDEVQVGAKADSAPSTASQQDIDNAPDSAAAPHFSPSRSALTSGADKPHEDTSGVETPTVAGTDTAVAPAPEGTKQAEETAGKRLEQAPAPEPGPARPELPEGAYDSEAFRAANSGARDAFGQVVVRPGDVFRDHGGRYVNIFDLEDVYDAEPGTVVPEGLFLFPVNYLVREDERAARIRG